MIELEETCPGCGTTDCKILVETRCKACDLEYYGLFGTADSRDIRTTETDAASSIKLRIQHTMDILDKVKKLGREKLGDEYPEVLLAQSTLRAVLEVIEHSFKV